MRKGARFAAVAVLAAAAALGLGGCGAPAGPKKTLTEADWRLVWADEFDGSSLDPGSWTHDTGASGWGNNELECYRSANAEVSGGFLTITARRESYGGASYTSSRIHTAGKRSFTYGKVEMRARLPRGQGIWPAFWMLGANSSAWGAYGGDVAWPGCGEIDIMEMVGGEAGSGRGDRTTHGTLHYLDSFGNNPMPSVSKESPARLSEAFHVYAIEWDATGVTWLLDGIAYGSTALGSDMEEFRKPFFLLLDLAVGGNWPGSPDATTSFPQSLVVDYVRVYEAASGR